jgi:hypothetical protein
VSVSSYQYDKLIFKLDNGQSWAQSEARALGVIRPGDDVTVEKGALGSFKMQFKRMGRAVKVVRKR